MMMILLAESFTEQPRHRRFEARRHLSRSFIPTSPCPMAGEARVHFDFKNLQGRRLCNLSGQSVPVVDLPSQKSFF